MEQIRDDELLNKIALKLKALREAKGLSQLEMFHETHINIGRLETGGNNLSVSTLLSLCNYFDITLVDFFMQLDIKKSPFRTKRSK